MGWPNKIKSKIEVTFCKGWSLDNNENSYF